MPDKILIVDMTHGGVKLATQFSKLQFDVYAWDIYRTLKQEQKDELQVYKVKLVDENFIKDNKPLIIAPVHCKLDYPVDMTHHEAVAYLLEKQINIPVIEVTGVKGKTSVVHMLKEIFKELNPLILSSLGIEIRDNNKWLLLKRNVSITPSNIITAWESGRKFKPGIFIVETSLGGTGLARVGVLTNMVEDYSVASGDKKASQAKAQIFKDELVCCDYESFHKYYTQFTEKTNTFDLNHGNVKATNITYGLTKTFFTAQVNGLKTTSGEVLKNNFKIETFAPAPHHVENVLSTISAALSCGVSVKTIQSGLKDFKGIKGRTSIIIIDDTVIIEEINPGINVTAVKRAIEMIKDLPRSMVIFGGQYGITCEEIDEKEASKVINQVNTDIGIILTDELGETLKDKVKRSFRYVEDYNEAVEQAQKEGYQHILLIYRSNYPDVLHR